MIRRKRTQRFVGDSRVRIGKMDNTLFWAERGLIRAEHQKTGVYRIISVKSFGRRMKALSEMLLNSPIESDNKQVRDMRVKLQDFITDGLDIMAQAKEQGMPSDASARRALKRQRAVTVHMGLDSNCYAI